MLKPHFLTAKLLSTSNMFEQSECALRDSSSRNSKTLSSDHSLLMRMSHSVLCDCENGAIGTNPIARRLSMSNHGKGLANLTQGSNIRDSEVQNFTITVHAAIGLRSVRSRCHMKALWCAIHIISATSYLECRYLWSPVLGNFLWLRKVSLLSPPLVRPPCVCGGHLERAAQHTLYTFALWQLVVGMTFAPRDAESFYHVYQ
eukprot:3948320-Amphidinium_carterae.1